MATNKKINECGWFYHAPAKPKAPQEPVLLPPTSQIPGLNTEMDGQFQDDPPRPLFRDSDSKYIRLAKQGGRQNLLYFKENPNMSERAPKGYPRPEWFYLEDNAIEDAEAKKREHPEFEQPYQFMVPEYMVHEEWRPETDSYQRPARLPYAYDRTSAYERDGHHVNDKTVKLPEVKKTGFGVRNAKPLRTKPKPVERTKPSTVAKQSQLEQERPHLKYLPLPDSDNKKDKASMSKILGYEYERKWHEDIDKWQYKQDRLRDQHKAMLTADDKDPRVSEYKTTFGKQGQQRPYVQEKGRKVWETTSNKSISARKTEKEEKELFKLSKFKNVGSRIDAKRSPKESPVSMANNQAPVPIAAH